MEEQQTGAMMSRSLLVQENQCEFEQPSDLSSITFTVVLSSFVAFCAPFVAGYDVAFTSPTESAIMEELGLSLAEYSTFGSIFTIGGLLGAALSGKIADLAGRKGAFWVMSIASMVGWLAIIFSKGVWSLDLGRLSLGFGAAVGWFVAPVYVAEITPKNLRGGCTSVYELATGTGASIGYLIGSFVNWRVLALLGTIPCLIQMLGLFFIPESPRWLAKIGRDKEVEASLRCLRGLNADISQEANEIKEHTENLQRISEDGILKLFQKRYARALTVGVGLMVVQQFGGLSGYAYYMTSIFDSAGLPSIVGYVAVIVSQLLMGFVPVILIDKSGRRPLVMASSAGTCLGSLLTGFSFLLQDLDMWEKVTPTMAFVGVLIFPINIKGSAGSLANLVSWVGAWFVSYTFNFLFEWSSPGVFFMYSSICFFGFIFVWKMGLLWWSGVFGCGTRKGGRGRKENLTQLRRVLVSRLEMVGENTTLKRFTLEEIKRATGNFSRDNIIGMGGHGNVYKGILADGSEVAFIRFKNCSAAGDEVFSMNWRY
ncbi:hypothetical protein FNV43_RR04853 [Rhamnella rubrinervis]|uniref:Major facilitator superfamily (MFS) profile domain-containing protein n=1 Tax=Rhamnella rubrinervis TaxID=2594499 RepID=A0A8K0HL12_9ROSA|nr:hypothetical protein FNV43_RR04853 [Rhamnella rubrinervis]